MTQLQPVLTCLLGLAGTLVGVLALYLAVLALAAFRFRPPAAAASARHRVCVLVPAHDEEALVARCVRSLLAQDYPRHLYQVVVIADNCGDRTAGEAVRAGADAVLRRDDPAARGKGQALRWAMDRILASPGPLDAVAVVDADSVADRGLLAGLAAELDRGAEVVQAEYLVFEEDASPRTALLSAAFLLFHRVRFRGRSVLGMGANLVGNGMLFTSGHLRRHPWTSFTGVEDLDHSMELRLAGVVPVFAGSGRVYGPMAGGDRAAASQRRRWEGGRFDVVRRRLPELLATAWRRREPRVLDAALDLAVPPLGILATVAVAGLLCSWMTAAAGLSSAAAVAPWAVAAGALVFYVVGGLRAADAPPSAYRALAFAPAFLLRKLPVYAGLLRGFDRSRWDRTERAGHVGQGSGG